VIPIVVEGDTDVPIAQRLLELVDLEISHVYGLRGKNWLDGKLRAYNAAARYAKWFGMRDLNGDAPCAGALVATLVPKRSAGLCLRLPVRASEAWLLADRDRIADFLSVRIGLLPSDPDGLADPKRELINLARRFRSRAIRADLVPDVRSTARVGPGYTARIIEFALRHWRPRTASANSASLRKCIAAIEIWSKE